MYREKQGKRKRFALVLPCSWLANSKFGGRTGEFEDESGSSGSFVELEFKNSFAFFDLVRNRGYGTGIEDRYAHERVVVIVQFVSHT